MNVCYVIRYKPNEPFPYVVGIGETIEEASDKAFYKKSAVYSYDRSLHSTKFFAKRAAKRMARRYQVGLANADQAGIIYKGCLDGSS